VAICHHGLAGGRVAARQASGFDRLIFLSGKVASETEQRHPFLRRRAVHLDWGFDLAFHKAVPGAGNYLIAAGKTGRDYDTLCLALSRVPVPAQIFCSAESAPTVPVPDGVSVIAGDHQCNAVSDLEMQDWYAQAFAVAVPLQDRHYLLGLTSVLDAMAHGKAVILTKTAYIDVDVDAEGCGISVAPGDIEGWAKAIRYLRDHPGEALHMGRRGRELSERRYNSREFSRSLMKLMNDLMRQDQSE
jgi:glycosyltransferase involved in cell wall biosynthesis